MQLEIFWGFITLIGVILSIKYRCKIEQIIGPILIGFTGCLWIAYIFG